MHSYELRERDYSAAILEFRMCLCVCECGKLCSEHTKNRLLPNLNSIAVVVIYPLSPAAV